MPAFSNLTNDDFILDSDKLIMGGKYFPSILCTLTTTPQLHSKEIENFRIRLKRDPLKYIWFAKQCQSLYGLYSVDVHDESKIAGSKYVDRKFIEAYTQHLPLDFKEAILLLWNENTSQ